MKGNDRLGDYGETLGEMFVHEPDGKPSNTVRSVWAVVCQAQRWTLPPVGFVRVNIIDEDQDQEVFRLPCESWGACITSWFPCVKSRS